MFKNISSGITILVLLFTFTAGCATTIAEPSGQAPAAAQTPTTTGSVAGVAAPVNLAPVATPNAMGFIDITVDELSTLLQAKNFTLINVHIPYEGELPQTDLFIPYNQISEHLDQLPAKDAPIVLYCRSGSMSTEAGAELARLGYTNVYELDGGFNAWVAAGYELLQHE